MKTKMLLISCVWCLSCIGVDLKDDVIREPLAKLVNNSSSKLMIVDKRGEKITTGDSAILELRKGQKQPVDIEYLNKYGIKELPSITWVVSKPSVASVSNNEITALAAGNTLVTGTIGTTKIKINLTVIGPIANIVASGKLVVMDNAGGFLAKGPFALLGLIKSEKQFVTLEYLNEFGIKEDKVFTWIVENPLVASVSSNNEITALAAGTTLLSAIANEASVRINLTVAQNSNEVTSVVVAAPSSSTLEIGQTAQLTATLKNSNNQNLPNNGNTIEWFSENSNILTVSPSGLVAANAAGMAEVHAKANGSIKSNSIKFTVLMPAGAARIGTFQSAGGYSSKGSVTVTETAGKLVVSLGVDFQASVALGTYIYLANSTSGSTVKSGGLELGQWSSGAKVFEANGVTLNQYKYVVVLCKPASVTFGFAELKP
ncbi:MAG: Ig-like domain-containing protein [Cyclobacteriaceae bacterium]